VIGQEIDGRD